MKKIIRLSMFGLVLGLSLYVFEAPCWSAEEASPVEGLLRKDRTELNEFLWKELVARTQKGSLTIEKPDMSQLILQIANTWEAPFFDLEWVAKTDVMASETNETQYVSLECTNSTYTLRIGILKSMDAEAAMQRAVEYAVMRSESYNRGSSSSCEEPEGKGTLWIDIPGASFIASFIPIEGYPDNVNYSIGNTVVWMTSQHNVGSPVSADRVVEASRLLNSILGGEAGRYETAGDEMDLDVLGPRSADNTVRIKWSLGGSLKGYWVRMDIDEGSLSIEEKGIVNAASVPDTGATVHLYAISPDGKTWFHKELKLPASE